MGKRVKYTKAEVFQAMLTMLPFIPDGTCSPWGVQIEKQTLREGRWVTRRCSFNGDGWTIRFRQSQHHDGRIRDAVRDFIGDREAFARWCLLMQAINPTMILPDAFRPENINSLTAEARRN